MKFIVGTGWDGTPEIIKADDEMAASIFAHATCVKLGMSAGDIDETTCWVEPYTEDRAFDFGLQPYEYRE